MPVVKKAGKPRPKTASSPKTAAPKKTSAKTKASELVPAASTAKASEYAIGDRISHPMFGEGVVTAIDAAKLTIEFADGITKQIVDYYVKPRKT